MRSELLGLEKSVATPVPVELLTSARRVDLARAGLIFLVDFLRRLSPRRLTILHDDLGEHLLCEPCEERWSRQIMTFFAKDIMAWSQSSLWRTA